MSLGVDGDVISPAHWLNEHQIYSRIHLNAARVCVVVRFLPLIWEGVLLVSAGVSIFRVDTFAVVVRKGSAQVVADHRWNALEKGNALYDNEIVEW